MQITPINNSHNFKGLNVSKVCSMDLKKIESALPKLEELGKKYEIRMISCYEGAHDVESIDVVVTPLKNTLNLWTKLFGPKGRTTYFMNKNNQKSLIENVNEAIKNLESKNKLGKLIDTFE